MKFSQRFVDELRHRLSIAQVVGAKVKLARRGTAVKGCCPFHHEKTPSFHVYEKDGHYHCFGCGAHGDAIDFVRLTQNISFGDAVVALAQGAGMPLPVEDPQETIKDTRLDALRALMKEACSYFQAQLKASEGWRAREYLKARAVSPDIQARFALGYAPEGPGLMDHLKARGFTLAQMNEAGLILDGRAVRSRFGGRVVFPIWDRQGRVIAFGGRILGEGTPKYLNSPETPLFHKGRELYAHTQAFAEKSKDAHLIVCEGYTDALSLYQAGYTRVVAPLGTALTPEQIALLWRMSSEPVLCFDGDMAGQKALARALERALPILKPGYSLAFVSLPKGEDPASLLERGQGRLFEQLLEAKKTLSQAFWDGFEVRLKAAKTPEARALIEKEFFDTLATITDEGVRGHYRQDMKDRLFTWQRTSSRKKTKQTQPTSPQGARVHASHMRAKAILVTFINHPTWLLDECEALMTLKMPTPALERVREEILEWVSAQKKLDAHALKAHLKEGGLHEAMHDLFSRDIYLHAPFAKTAATQAEVVTGWRGLLESWHLLEEGLGEVLSWKNTLSTDLNPHTWSQVRRLRTSMEKHYEQLTQEGEPNLERLEGSG